MRRHSHFADESILIDGSPFLSSSELGRLRPHLFHILQYHITMPIEGLYSGQ